MEYFTEIEKLREILHSASHAVFFGGAGVSTDSGIPDFRNADGLYGADSSEDEPEYMLSRTCLIREPERFFDYYRKNMLYPNAQPNAAHRALKELEEKGIIKAVITQNIDGLHQLAGSRCVMELHGSVHRNYCEKCGKTFSYDYVAGCKTCVPLCDSCGGIVRPDVVLYEEGLDLGCFYRAEKEIHAADVLIVGGTSLVVNPAASLVGEFTGKHLIIINYTSTPYDRYAELIIRDSISDVLSSVL